jgi:hypothetical protein
MSTFKERLKNSWSAFLGRDPTITYQDTGPGYSYRPDRTILTRGNSRSIVSSIYNIIATDVASIDIKHVKVNENGQYVTDMDSHLNEALTRSANIDQSGRALIKDLALSMFDEGVIAVVPVLTEGDPNVTDSFDIYELRVAKIVEWFPRYVKVRIYNDRTGQKVDKIVSKKYTAIIENPFYMIMNEPNSTLQRLKRILSQIDQVNDKSASSKLDLIIQLPYSTRGNARQSQADERRKRIEGQLTGPLGIAYIDVNEKVTQLNRPIANNLWEQAKDLTEQVYNQLGLAKSIFDGTADEQVMLNYYNRTIDPIMAAITEEFQRKFLSDVAITRGQAIRYFRAPFKLVPTNNLAEIADKFTRNEILSSNEFRSILGMKPSSDPRADELINSNINHPDEEPQVSNNPEENFQNEEYYGPDEQY